MGGLSYNLGRKVGSALRKGKWAFQSLTGSESDIVQKKKRKRA